MNLANFSNNVNSLFHNEAYLFVFSLLLRFNPIHKKVPLLLHNGKSICESLVILEYMDQIWKQFPLLPQDPLERANARFWAKFGDDKILPSIYYGTFLKQGKEQEEGIASTMENLNFVEQELGGKKFFGGDKIGLADITLGWLAHYVSVFEEILGLTIIDQQKSPFLFKWIQEFASTPIIQESWPPRDKLVAKFVAARKSSFGE
ncbi:probable glutathione S-transferase [Mercurialis annua]|uniref:probable glutathione S-transferase n=1 Tax=Mercurialis annua TaxID=3986 RepID=UPI00215FC5D4|nr:probable glutathione S-transferase [Mercurialis annua]